MNTRAKVRAVAAAGVVVMAATAGMFQAGAAAADSQGVATVMTLVDHVGFTPVSQVDNGDGTFTDSWAHGSDVITVAARPGTVVTVQPAPISLTPGTTNSVQLAVAGASIDKSSPTALDEAAAAYAAAGRSVVQDAIATGMDPVAAEQQFGHMMGEGATEPAVTGGGGRMPGMSAMPFATTNAAPVYDSWCSDLSSDGGRVHSHGCIVRRKDYVNGSDWYLEDATQISGVSTDTCTACFTQDRLTKLYVDVGYPSGNTMVKWAPTSTVNQPDSCRDFTISLASPKTGLGYSETAHVCADNIGPHTVTSTKFGSVWNGKEPKANWWEATEALDVDHSPPTASASATLYTGYSWSG